MSTSDETQQGTPGARTTTTPRADAGTGPEATQGTVAPSQEAGTKKPRRGMGRGTPAAADTAPTAAASGAVAPARTGTGPARPASGGASKQAAAGRSSGAAAGGAPAAGTAPGTTGAKKAGAEKPGAEKPGAEKPGAEKPGAEKPGAEKPGAEKPASTKPAAEAASATATATGRPAAPRRVRLTVARLDPWSVMKLSFLLSVALGIAFVVASGVLWSILDGMGVYTDVSRVVGEIIGDGSFDLTVWVGFGRTLSLVTVLAVVNVVLLTAISTLGAFLYNISAALVGGLHVTLSDD